MPTPTLLGRKGKRGKVNPEISKKFEGNDKNEKSDKWEDQSNMNMYIYVFVS